MVDLLVVDDNPDVRQLARAYAEEGGCRVVGEATDGAAAVEFVDSHHVDIVLMDFHMPKLDGLAATRLIRARHPDVRIIAWTSALDPSIEKQFIEIGAQHVPKVETERLRRIVAEACGAQDS